MKTIIKLVIKKTPIYQMHRRKTLRQEYARKFDINYADIAKKTKVIQYNPEKILAAAKPQNVGYGSFCFPLDISLIIDKRSRVIDNMPVDYKYVINRKIGDSGLENAIREYVNKIDDSRITLEKPKTLKDALQSILFWNSLLWQTGHTLVGLGRLDKVLDGYHLSEDSEQLICDFLRSLHSEFIFKSTQLKGDTGQIIILGGLETDGSYFVNEYTYLFIKCLKLINLPDPKILLRCSKDMPQDLMEIAIDCASTGIGSPLFSNDDVVVPLLMDFGYERADAFNYGVSACWEPLSIGNSLEQNNLGNIVFGQYVNETMLDDNFIDCSSFEDVFGIFQKKLSEGCLVVKKQLDSIIWQQDSLLTMMMGLEKDISMGGAKYNNYGILSVGMASAVNSLLNIQKYVFDEKKFSLDEIQKRIENNDVDYFCRNEEGFGVDSRNALEITNRIIKETEKNLSEYRNVFGGKVKFGLSSPSYVGTGKEVGATLDGRKAGEPFATHISRDKCEPITEIINFESKLHFSGISSNANVIDIMVQAPLIRDNVNKFAEFLMGGIKQGMFQLQMNVVSYRQLIEAKNNPEKYPGLIVRVWGFSAYFNDLPEEYKDNLIKRAKEIENVI